MRYEFRYRPHNTAGDAYFECSASVVVEPLDDSYQIVVAKMNGAVVDKKTPHWEAIDDYLQDHHLQAINDALHGERVPAVTDSRRTRG